MAKSWTAEDLEDWLIERIGQLTKTQSDSIDPDKPLQVYGLTSLMGVEIAADLEDLLGIPVEATSAWDYPTVTKLSAHLATELSRNAS
jgi:acyl carrier protein